MASSTSNDLKLELITTGEKSGTWGTITNTNLQILEQAASGYLSLDVAAADVALSLANYATSNGKNLYYKFTGTLTANRTVTMPDSAERVFIVEDATDRSASLYTLTVKTVSGTGITIPVGSKIVLYSDGTNISRGPITKGYITPGATYTAVNGDQVLVDTSGGGIGAPVTINLPASPSVGDEVHFIDSGANLASNNLTIGRNSSNILGSASDLVVSTNAAAFTLVYVNATRGWAYKDNI
jgi:phage baseplate assembly protein gpV